MTGSQHYGDGDRLDLYLDGLLVGEELEAFERRLLDDPILRVQVAAQRAINGSLLRLFSPPELAAIATEGNGRIFAPTTPTRHPRRGLGLSRRVAVAAILGLGVIGILRIWSFFNPRRAPNPYDPGPKRTLVEAYRFEVSHGFAPDWVCDSPEQASDLLRRRFGQGLLLAESPGLSAIGWSYLNTITPNSAALLVRAGEEQIMVFVDRLAADPGQSIPPGSDLTLHRYELDKLVLYQVSRANAPVILDRFRAQ